HKKYRLAQETIRLPYRVIYIQNGLFQLLSIVGILDQYQQGYNLNFLKGFDNTILKVPIETQKITIGKAYMKIYNRPLIADLQPKGQKCLAAKAKKDEEKAKLKASKGKCKGKGKGPVNEDHSVKVKGKGKGRDLAPDLESSDEEDASDFGSTYYNDSDDDSPDDDNDYKKCHCYEEDKHYYYKEGYTADLNSVERELVDVFGDSRDYDWALAIEEEKEKEMEMERLGHIGGDSESEEEGNSDDDVPNSTLEVIKVDAPLVTAPPVRRKRRREEDMLVEGIEVIQGPRPHKRPARFSSGLVF
ncbi:hypothetical protein B0J14DRAFT_600161, partial [Halenospora varia]